MARDKMVTWLVVLSLVLELKGFNLDVNSRVLYRGPAGSSFGASLDFHRAATGTAPGLVVGAPFAMDAETGSARTGAVFRCPAATAAGGLGASTSCDRLPLTLEDAKPDQMMGATVRTSPIQDLIVACAPRYWYRTWEQRRLRFSWNLVGNCLLARKNLTRIQEFSPCKNRAFQRDAWHEEGFCEAGASAAFTQRGDVVFGAPGSFLWEGQVYSIDRLTGEVAKTDQRQGYFDDYSGVSIAVGDLSGNGEEDFVIGGPRAKRIMGLVSIINKNMEFVAELIGEQLASGFGSSICVTDVNGDGRQDVLMGAPFYSKLGGPTIYGDVGRVYVFHCNPQLRYCGLIAGSIRDTKHITGQVAGGRFGTAMVAMGDMDSDGFNDVAVGAPHTGKAGEGVVYIFRGSPGGLRKEHSIAVEASAMGIGLKSFGYSLSGGTDIDGNFYPDLAVGAFESDAVAVLRSVPVIDITTAVLSVHPKVVDPETRRCTAADGGRTACFNVMLCVEYDGKGVPDTQDFPVTVLLDGPLLPIQRAVLKQGRSRLVMSLLKKQTSCLVLEVHLKDEIRDKLTPISVEATMTIALPQGAPPGQLSPVLRPDADTHLHTQVNISRTCGLDDICVPDLRVQAHGSTTSVSVGDTTSVVLEVTVSNRGEDSYESQLFALVPEEVDYVGAQRVQTNTPAMCSYAATDAGGAVSCEVGNPLKADSKVVLQLRFLVANLNGSRRSLDFVIFANSSTPDDISTTNDNRVTFSAQVVVHADVTAKGASLPRDVWLENVFTRQNSSQDDPVRSAEKDISDLLIKHVYEIKNLGPSDVGQTITTVLWPAMSKNRSLTVAAPNVVLKNQHGYCLVDNVTASMCTNVDDCYTISCIVSRLGSGDSFVLEIRSEIEHTQLTLDGNMTQDRVMSSVQVTVMDMPYQISPSALPTAHTNVTTVIHLPRPVTRRKRVKAWIIMTAALSGLLVLVAIVLLLYRLGFFDRSKVSQKDDVDDPNDPDLDSGIQEDEDGYTCRGH